MTPQLFVISTLETTPLSLDFSHSGLSVWFSLDNPNSIGVQRNRYLFAWKIQASCKYGQGLVLTKKSRARTCPDKSDFYPLEKPTRHKTINPAKL